jgi:hypothetical protein
MAHEHRIFGLGVVGAGMAAKPHALALNALRDRIAVRGVWRRTSSVPPTTFLRPRPTRRCWPTRKWMPFSS